MIAIVDYGMGNLRSVQKAFESAGTEARIVSQPSDIAQADKLVLPGVGAMKPAMERLNELRLISPLKAHIASNKPFLGICLGFQLLFDSSTEGGMVTGLGVVSGTVQRFPETVKVPQIGWNNLSLSSTNSRMFDGMTEDRFVYFCHSYYVLPKDLSLVSAWADYGLKYTAALQSGNIWGVQFHPEKSQAAGARILKNFAGQL